MKYIRRSKRQTLAPMVLVFVTLLLTSQAIAKPTYHGRKARKLSAKTDVYLVKDSKFNTTHADKSEKKHFAYLRDAKTGIIQKIEYQGYKSEAWFNEKLRKYEPAKLHKERSKRARALLETEIAAKGEDKIKFAPAQIIVGFDEETDYGKIYDIIESVEGGILQELPLNKVYVIYISGLEDLQLIIKELNNFQEVQYAHLNYKAANQSILPNDYEVDEAIDTYHDNENSWNRSNLPMAWNLFDKNKNGTIDLSERDLFGDVVIAIVDSGVDYNHDDLWHRIWENPGEIYNNGIDDDENGYVDDFIGWDFAYLDDNNPMDEDDPITITKDEYGHGTNVAGIASATADNYIGMAGVAWAATIMPVRTSVFVDSRVAGIVYAAKNGADIINMSFGGYGSDMHTSDITAYVDACGYAYYEKDCVLIAGAGNDGENSVMYPAALNNVICVGGLDRTGTFKTGDSNYGSGLDLAAPYFLVSTSPGNNLEKVNGTSFSAPFVSGVAALMRVAAPNHFNSDIRQLLDSSEVCDDLGTAGWDEQTGWGRINAYKAVKSVITSFSPTSGNNGTIFPDEDFWIERATIEHQTSAPFIATPDSGYVVDHWEVNGQLFGGSTNSISVTGSQENITVLVTFKPQNGSGIETITLDASATDQILSHWPNNPQSGSTIDIYNNASIGGYKGHGFVKFNLASIPSGSTVNSAELKMYCYSDDGNGEIDINRSLKDWSESVSWNTYYPTAGEVLADETNRGGADFWWIWYSSDHPQIKSCVQGWVDGTYSNYGFLITPGYMSSVDPTYGSNVKFWGVNTTVPALIPKLVVTYIPPLPSLPDLMITDLYPVPDPVANIFYVGQSVRWEVTVKNNSSDASADSSFLGYYLGNSPTDVSESTRIKTDTVDPLAPGGSDDEDHIHPFTNSDIGTKYLICKADNDNSINETDENNNTWVYGPFTVQEPGGLIVSIYPQEAVDDGAMWRIDGGTWRDSGYTETDLSVGLHTVKYQSTYYWNAPASHTVQINPDQITSITKQYTRKADINLDDNVNLIDFSIMANRWKDTPCIEPYWCEKADIDKSGVVDFNDLLIMTKYWLTEDATVQADFVADYNGSSPTIDGVLSAGEWGSSYTVTMDRVDGGGQHDIDLYFQNDGVFLFIGVDSQWGSGWDVVWDIFIDGDYSRTLNGNLSQPYTDIQVCQQSPTGYPGYRAYRTLTNTGEVRVGFGSGADCASSGSTNVSYEFRVPLADLDVIPEASVGFTIAHGYDGISEHLYELSLSVSRTTPENWATLKLDP